MDKKEITNQYTEFILLNGHAPTNVFAFTKKIGITEAEFYQHFSSFTAINQWVFVSLFDDTFALQKKSKEYLEYSDQEKLLSFYYTYFELLTSNRSLILQLIHSKKTSSNLKVLKLFKVKFIAYAETIERPTFELPIEQLESLQDKGFAHVMWGQFLVILKYWLDDESPSFMKTDQLIEKSTSLGFELLNKAPIEKAIDLGKFLFRDKLKSTFK